MPGRRGHKRWSADGTESVQRVAPKMQFTIPTKDRLRNQGECSVKHLDMFTNGTYRLLDPGDAEDLKDISEGALITDAEIEQILDSHHKTMQSKVGKIESNAVLDRLLNKAREVGAGDNKVKMIRERQRALSLARGEMPNPIPGDMLAKGHEKEPDGKPSGPGVVFEMDGDPGPRRYSQIET